MQSSKISNLFMTEINNHEKRYQHHLSKIRDRYLVYATLAPYIDDLPIRSITIGSFGWPLTVCLPLDNYLIKLVTQRFVDAGWEVDEYIHDDGVHLSTKPRNTTMQKIYDQTDKNSFGGGFGYSINIEFGKLDIDATCTINKIGEKIQTTEQVVPVYEVTCVGGEESW